MQSLRRQRSHVTGADTTVFGASLGAVLLNTAPLNATQRDAALFNAALFEMSLSGRDVTARCGSSPVGMTAISRW